MLRTILVPSQDKRIGIPPGGTTGQCLVKASDADGDVAWSSNAPVETESTLDNTSTKPITSQAVSNALEWGNIESGY